MDVTPITVRYIYEVTSYLLHTETGYFLIDTGIAKRRRRFERALQTAGCQPHDLKLILITHGHIDHVGNAAYLRDTYEAKIAMHRDDARLVESGDMFIDTQRGIMIRVISGVMKLLGLSDYERFTPDIYLQDNQDLSAYGLDAHVIHTPGHSNGSISIRTKDSDVFCGDLLTNTNTPAKNTLIQNADILDASVEKLRALATATIYPGHGKPFHIEQLT